MRAYRLPMDPIVKVNTPTGGTYPKSGGFFAKLQEQARQAQEEQMKKNGQSSNGTLNGKTGTPAKHKPKKRK